MRESVEKRQANEAKKMKNLLSKQAPVVAALVVFLGSVFGLASLTSHAAQRTDYYQLTAKVTGGHDITPDSKSISSKAKTYRLNIAAAPKPGVLSEVTKAEPTNNSSQPQDCNPSTSHTNPNSIDVVVNKKHCMVPINFTPALSTVNCAGTTGYLQAVAANAFQQLCNAAAADGLPISITSSFRSYSNQVATYSYWVSANGSAAAADRVSARPGFSEHQTGFVVDVAAGGCGLECFSGTGQYGWMQNNAYKYGFIQRYHAGQEAITGYDPEPWHYRYVGVSVATDMKNRGIKTLEQYFGVEGGDYR